MIAIGFLRWLFNYQRTEIQLLFEVRGIHISAGEISNLSEEFLLRFYVLHQKHNSQLKELFQGGFILHLDGTAEAGDEVTFTAKEGLTGITIDSWIMPSEGREYILPFLEHIRETYGNPLVVIRDMWKEISTSVSTVFPSVKQQICHYHFIRNLGELIFKHQYEALRQSVLNTKILARLLALKKHCTISHSKLVTAEHLWARLAIEYLLNPRECKSDYPFVLPYFEILNRVVEVRSLLHRIVMWNAWHNFGVEVVLKLNGYLKKLIAVVDTCYREIKRLWNWFEELRGVLRVSRELSEKEQNNTATSATEVKPKFEETLRKIREKGRRGAGNELREISEKIYGTCEEHMAELFVEVKDKDNMEVKIVRHNGVEELGHRWSRMHIRRRTGRSRTTKEMNKYGALLSVFSNLENEAYIQNVLANIKDFTREMQNITEKELQEAKKQIRTNPQAPLIRSDAQRPKILQEFIQLIDESDEIPLEKIEKWLSHFKTDAIMTP